LNQKERKPSRIRLRRFGFYPPSAAAPIKKKKLKKSKLKSAANLNFSLLKRNCTEREKAAFGLVYFLAKAIHAPVF